MRQFLSVKNDFVFKKLFGEPGSEDVLISFLKYVLDEDIDSLEILKGLNLEKRLINDKQCFVDVRANLADGSRLNIEIQLKNEYNLNKRTFYYLSKLYIEGFEKGQDYKSLNKAVTINICDYNVFGIEACHYRFRLKEERFDITDFLEVMEIHFLDLTKIKTDANENIVLKEWLEFIKADDDEVIRMLSKKNKDILKASKKLEELSSDEEIRLIAESRAKYLSDYNSNIAGAEAKGRFEEKMEIIKRMVSMNVSLKDISKMVNLSVDEVKELIVKSDE
ncbi:Rpn family recombination-promoting nuclease/putative transposase [Acidaminobacter sp. JC074]|uniref:Rpn family recombination-promoting nuclease/putative transposase n=1 Tax=Acidaminobacter sp. JC074 TaxID=2530199 RepID=UPI001F0FBE14|nr:Rpn family recombination-promoting nuclease/putative transposase [Acidaminobacter sp. JC074]